MQEREAAIGKIMASRSYSRQEVEDLQADWADAKGLSFTDYVPDEDVNEIIAILHEDVSYKYAA